MTIVEVLAASFSELESVVAVEIVAVFVNVVESGVFGGMLAVTVNTCPVVGARVPIKQTTLPVEPGEGCVQLHPAGNATEANVMPGGSGSLKETLAALALLTTVIV